MVLMRYVVFSPPGATVMKPASPAKAPNEQRGEWRCERHGRVVVKGQVAGQGLVSADAVLIDASPNGVCVIAPIALNEGADLLISRDRWSPIVLIYEVRGCEQEGDQYRIRGHYVGALGSTRPLDANAAYAEIASATTVTQPSRLTSGGRASAM